MNYSKLTQLFNHRLLHWVISLNKQFVSLFFNQSLVSSSSPILKIVNPVFVEMNDLVGTNAQTNNRNDFNV